MIFFCNLSAPPMDAGFGIGDFAALQPPPFASKLNQFNEFKALGKQPCTQHQLVQFTHQLIGPEPSALAAHLAQLRPIFIVGSKVTCEAIWSDPPKLRSDVGYVRRSGEKAALSNFTPAACNIHAAQKAGFCSRAGSKKHFASSSNDGRSARSARLQGCFVIRRNILRY